MGLSNLGKSSSKDPSQRALYSPWNGLVYWNDLRTLLAHKALDQPNLMMTPDQLRLISFSNNSADSCCAFRCPTSRSALAWRQQQHRCCSIPSRGPCTPAGYGSKPWPFEGSLRSLPQGPCGLDPLPCLRSAGPCAC